MNLFGKPKATEFDTVQDATLASHGKSITSIVNWCNKTNKHIEALYQEIASLKGYDKKHDALFKSMQETDATMQGVLDALSKLGQTEASS